MINRFMISVAALALVAGTGLANAQDKMGRDSGSTGAQPTQQQSQPAERGGAMNKEMNRDKDATKDKGTVGQAGGAMKSEDKSGAMKDDKSGTMHKSQSADDKAGATKGQRTDERAQDKSQHQDKSKSMSSESQTKPGTKDMKAEDSKSGAPSKSSAETRPGTSTDMKAQGQTGTSSSTTVGQAGAGAKLSTEQRTQITSVIREEKVAPATNVNFNISVGTRVPREGITLHVLPPRVVTIYPEWRSYKYIVVREEIVIIDPNTYEIVAVLNV
ncbi:DUF1236 domain-containing protein [Bradyrhizobium manausense]|uniref:DUF1236 domain-containing protein n=1 Tax=Bradyrhizobium TaxID=374 RepID=UPI001BAADA5B|nr:MULTISPECIES: DUF1236 domain-containing protein [Bradyrhizobium]MBR0828334.1 DUF1236 domain-containing protein [Bradyrhizobium manausense]UVO25599.1 DUF1236 domain-containing protein [Bradyrhizobium arachidis]